LIVVGFTTQILNPTWFENPDSNTIVNVEWSRILTKVLNTNLLAQPRKTLSSPNDDPNKYCRFHRNYGHTTKECIVLKDKIKELIQVGHLRQYVQRSQLERYERREQLSKRDKQREKKREDGKGRGLYSPLQWIIKTIAGGIAGRGNSTSLRKKHLRAVHAVHSVNVVLNWSRRNMLNITFSDEDFQMIDPNQHYPMVITIKISDFAITKTLVDQGIMVDMLYWKTFQHLGLSADTLKPRHYQIVGFSRNKLM